MIRRVILLYSLLFMFLAFLKAQTSNHSNCAEGRREAIEDLRAGKLGYYFMGRPSLRSQHYIRLFQDNYGVEVKGGGCIIDQSIDCYNELMRTAICDQFGSNAFERIGQQLDSLYEIGLGDREAYYVGGDSALYHYLYCNIDQDLLFADEGSPSIVVATITIGTNGTVNSVELIYKRGSAEDDPRYGQTALKILSNMPAWEAGFINGKHVESQWNIPIYFRLSAYNRYCLCIGG